MKTLAGLAKALRGLDGEPLMDENERIIALGPILANSLARGQADEPARAMNLALKIFNHAEDMIELEDSDYDMVKEAVARDQLLNNMSKAACLELFGHAEP